MKNKATHWKWDETCKTACNPFVKDIIGSSLSLEQVVRNDIKAYKIKRYSKDSAAMAHRL
jgi:hypothetical protein